MFGHSAMAPVLAGCSLLVASSKDGCMNYSKVCWLLDLLYTIPRELTFENFRRVLLVVVEGRLDEIVISCYKTARCCN